MALENRYQMIRELGAGAMGVVYLAVDNQNGQMVAVKKIQESQLLAGRTRMRREYRALSQVHHPNVVQVLDLGEENGIPFLVMEYIKGQDLSEWLTSQPDFTSLCSMFALISDGLSAVHAQGIIHRDLKPDNIRVNELGVPKLMDFGLVKTSEGSLQSRAGQLIGTPLYMSPEQCQGVALDYRADLYALGVVLYQALTGTPPFQGELIRVITQHISEMPIAPRSLNTSIPEALEKICLNLLAKERDKRPPSAAVVRDTLQVAVQSNQLKATVELSVQTARADALLLAPLIGREKEVSALNQWLEAGEAGIFIVTGDIGLGKTRLLRTFAEQAQSNYIFVGRAEAMVDDPTPFGLIKRLIDALEKRFAFVFDEISANAKLELARIASQFGQVPQTDGSIPIEITRLRLFEAFSELLQKISELTVVILENLHWADTSTLALLAHALRTTPNARVILSYRTEDLPEGQQSLKGFPISKATFALTPLDQTQMRQLVKALLGGEIETALEKELIDRADGNPWVLEERLKAMLECGAIQHRAEHYEWNRSTPSIPPSLSGLLKYRIDVLEPQALEFARVASVLGRAFWFEDARAMLDWSDDQAFDALESLTRAKLVAEDARTNGERFRFTHPTYHELLREGILRLKRKRLHAKAAQQRTGQAEAAELAEHWFAAENYSQALEYALQAGTAAQAAFAYPQAERAYRLALEAINSLETDAELTEVQRLFGLQIKHALGEVLSYTGATAEAMRLWREVLAQATGEQNSQDIAALAKVDLVRLMRFSDDHQKALELIGEPKSGTPLYGLLCVELSNLWRKDDLPKARAYALAAVQSAKLEQKKPDLIRAILGLSKCVKQPERQIALARIAANISKQESNNYYALMAYNDLGSALYRQNLRSEAFLAWETAMDFAEAVGDLRSRITLDMNRSLILMNESRFAEAQRILKNAQVLATKIELLVVENVALSNIALCEYGLNDLIGARTSFRKVKNHTLEKFAQVWQDRITLELGDADVLEIPQFEDHEFGFGIFQLTNVLQALTFGNFESVWEQTKAPNHESDWHWALARVHAGWRLGLRDEIAIAQILEGRAKDPTLSQALTKEFAVFVELLLQPWTVQSKETLAAQATKFSKSPIGLLARDVLQEIAG